jgi:hypothetical protein
MHLTFVVYYNVLWNNPINNTYWLVDPTMADSNEGAMARGRALLTDVERRHIGRKTNSDQFRYEAVSRVRARLREEPTEDVELLGEYHPDLLEELHDIVATIK